MMDGFRSCQEEALALALAFAFARIPR